MRKHLEIKSKSDTSEEGEMPPLKDCSDVEYLVD
jgi:hypothetical protein